MPHQRSCECPACETKRRNRKPREVRLCNSKGMVIPRIDPRMMTRHQSLIENEDFHRKGIDLVWIVARRIKDGKVVKPAKREE